jgi:hypothetical protein
VALLVFHFAIGLWDYSHSVALFIYLLDFGTDQRVWHYFVFYWALEIFPQCGIIGKINNATLSEQFQSPIEKQIMPNYQNSFKIPYQNK